MFDEHSKQRVVLRRRSRFERKHSTGSPERDDVLVAS